MASRSSANGPENGTVSPDDKILIILVNEMALTKGLAGDKKLADSLVFVLLNATVFEETIHVFLCWGMTII
ncbi:hypothetical protein UB31_35770 [Bradyrhizobium sp. LTSP849]|uniref:hypothetical protein n=1 Tax=Bradyrhizobium sp. LTSP849 TaxID=1615890 RepID=UPI0005D1AD0B|nr:hypothetical protein [Bradyrhizobium sp. LTSP849]KJC36739.1 hypothetical protein UB31_35770 [Bradyrhizobium sp. LTSP849]